MNETKNLGVAVLDMLTSFDDSACYVRCEHGGACGLKPGHSGPHDSDGHRQWTDNE